MNPAMLAEVLCRDHDVERLGAGGIDQRGPARDHRKPAVAPRERQDPRQPDGAKLRRARQHHGAQQAHRPRGLADDEAQGQAGRPRAERAEADLRQRSEHALEDPRARDGREGAGARGEIEGDEICAEPGEADRQQIAVGRQRGQPETVQPCFGREQRECGDGRGGQHQHAEAQRHEVDRVVIAGRHGDRHLVAQRGQHDQDRQQRGVDTEHTEFLRREQPGQQRGQHDAGHLPDHRACQHDRHIAEKSTPPLQPVQCPSQPSARKSGRNGGCEVWMFCGHSALVTYYAIII